MRRSSSDSRELPRISGGEIVSYELRVNSEVEGRINTVLIFGNVRGNTLGTVSRVRSSTSSTFISTGTNINEELSKSPSFVIGILIKSSSEFEADLFNSVSLFVVDIHQLLRPVFVSTSTDLNTLVVLEVLSPNLLSINGESSLFIVPRFDLPELELDLQAVVRRKTSKGSRNDSIGSQIFGTTSEGNTSTRVSV